MAFWPHKKVRSVTVGLLALPKKLAQLQLAFWAHKKVGTVTVGVFADIFGGKIRLFFKRSIIFLTAVVFFESWNDKYCSDERLDCFMRGANLLLLFRSGRPPKR